MGALLFILSTIALLLSFFASHGQSSPPPLNYGKLILIDTYSKKMEFNQRAVANGIEPEPRVTRIVDTNNKNNVPKSPSANRALAAAEAAAALLGTSNFPQQNMKKHQTKSVPASPHKPTTPTAANGVGGAKKKIKSVPNSPQKPTASATGGPSVGGGMWRKAPKTVPNSPQQPSSRMVGPSTSSRGASSSSSRHVPTSPHAAMPPSASWWMPSPRSSRPSSAGAEVHNDAADENEMSFSITMMRNDLTQIVAEYGLDPNRDMFQIGRARHEKIDFVIENNGRTSRFACRLVAERNAPENVYIYAAGFDETNNIFLGVGVTEITKPNGQFDSLVTNGIMILPPVRESRPQEATTSTAVQEIEPSYKEISSSRSSESSSGFRAKFSPKMKKFMKHPIEAIKKKSREIFSPRKEKESVKSAGDIDDDQRWRLEEQDNSPKDVPSSLRWVEVSITGDIYSQREMRRAGLKGELLPHLTNKLEDGTLIDICGATLLWRSAHGLRHSPTEQTLVQLRDMLNNGIRPQDPVFRHTLKFRRYREESTTFSKSGTMKTPHVYDFCGHVQSKHGWRGNARLHNANAKHKCPLCNQHSDNVIKLTIGDEPAFHMDSEGFDYAFNPCGHIASRRTVEHWSGIEIPDAYGVFHTICPFCNQTLNEQKPSIKLYFSQDED